jgi:2',3'-cyclic-nucleotide 2'-phosphodiesterase/3'-nucleotidase
MFTIYPYENALYVLRLTGSEIKGYLERSYDKWIQTLKPGGNVLNIVPRSDPRNDQVGWSFVERSYNFDSASGINYTVDVTKPFGSRIVITSMADGTPFQPEKTYNVAMTSYRASGGGNLLDEIGIDTDRIDERVVARYPEIRNILYDYLKEKGSIDPAVVGDPKFIGSWRFVPERIAAPAVRSDLTLLFGSSSK